MRPALLAGLLVLARPAYAQECPSGSTGALREDETAGALPRAEELRPAPPGSIDSRLDDLDRQTAVEAAERTRRYWDGQPPQRAVLIGGRRYEARHLAKSLRAFAELLKTVADSSALHRELERLFDVFEAVEVGGGKEGLITGYYDPELPLVSMPSPGFVPVHARPADLVATGLGPPLDWGRRREGGGFVAHDSRDQIRRGSLSGKGLELYWTRHASELLIAQTQGTAIGVLPDGRRARLAFDGSNGHPFRAVGKALIDCGILPRGTSSAAIRRFLKEQSPAREAELVALNPRYAFFRDAGATAPPTGALGIALTGGRSLAVDPRFIPLGLPGFLISKKPVAGEDGRIVEIKPFSRFIFSHDVGSAIRGEVRADLFFGSGRRESEEAHHMAYPGRIWVFVLKPN